MTLAAENFSFVADLVRRRSAIQLEAGKEYLVESRLLPLARTAGTVDVDAYIRSLRSVASPAALEAVVEALTTNETSWFRDAQPFATLTDHVVPELLGARGAAGPLRIWSAACSTGQEPYSIAMTLADLVPGGRLRILGTDLNQQVLARARTGRYSQLEVNRGLPVSMLVKHFTRAGVDWEVAAPLRSAISFAQHNLLDVPPAGGPFDVVFLRNVLIYFDLATKRDVLRRVQRVVRPGGYLLLGAAETTIGIDDDWERVTVGRGSVYRLNARRAA
ncbi:protein-glutamate O-methyltransferase CheR [Actinotalea sp.]|uniref:CheR family methyltransferase n=1 Tax=Actinotalea sp. TaxID=1872145 RepID=UPI002C79CAED|nr:protein-glutamate O-methyltransferase CheR [Actinotalea sp.]HQY32409.1 protein-glutamate O-methyltransferase CheR [Actinotalea sp.]HRA49565.1 protein-glutamate O-methyltransferase CheR [Actinotalea sp.]